MSVKVVFDSISLFDGWRLSSGVDPTWLAPRAVNGQGWPQAIAQRRALDGHEHGGRLRTGPDERSPRAHQAMTIPRGARNLARSAAQPCIRLIREDRNHDAVMRIAAKPRAAGPFFRAVWKTMGCGRVTATSDRYRQSCTGLPKWLSGYPSPSALLLRTPDAGRRPAASRPS